MYLSSEHWIGQLLSINVELCAFCGRTCREGTLNAVGPDAVLGRYIPRCSVTGARHGWHGPGPWRNDGEVGSIECGFEGVVYCVSSVLLRLNKHSCL